MDINFIPKSQNVKNGKIVSSKFKKSFENNRNKSQERFKIDPKKENTVYSLDIVNGAELLKYVGFIKNKPVNVVFDTGAIASVIGKTTTEKLNLKILPSDVKINTADGSAHSIIGVTENLSIEIDDIITEISFLVTNITTADVLLGLDCFNHSNATIDPA